MTANIDQIDATAECITDADLSSQLNMPVRDAFFVEEDFNRWFNEREHLNYTRAIRYYCAINLMCINESSILLDVGGGEGDLYRSIKADIAGIKIIDYGQYCEDLIERDDFITGNILDHHASQSYSHIYLGHTFEHFKGDDDTKFIHWLSQSLDSPATCCIEPVFVGKNYVEVYAADASVTQRFDDKAMMAVTSSSAFPGKVKHGMGFGRIYSPDALKKRILEPARAFGLNVELVTCHLGNASLPDMERYQFKRHSVNHPLRMMLLTPSTAA